MNEQEKANLRRHALEWRDALDERVKRAWSSLIAKRLMARNEWRTAATVFFYYAVRGEVQTRAMIEASWQAGKQVALPIVEPKERKLEFALIREWDELIPDVYGIPAPRPDCAPRVQPHADDLLIVPGVLFDMYGYRIGYGGGYYDRLLAEFPDVCSVGLAYEQQVRESIPHERWDRRVRLLVTEQRTIECLTPK